MTHFSHLRSVGYGRSIFQQRFLGQGSSNSQTSKINKNRVSNPKPQGGNNGRSSMPTYTRYGEKHNGKCLAGTGSYFNYRKSGLKMRDCQLLASKGKDGKYTQPSGSNLGAPRQNRFYALQIRN
ncbi:hypothetical protein RDI58_016401 [Solanum bulbocastanum]|uniref:Uncharacterized protein n=1 Tax=Solanum bulbocastanum TaxID=147425 RepID=A0AAN8TLV9_SOLBU